MHSIIYWTCWNYSHCPRAGHHVCKAAWLHLMGIGKHRIARCKNVFKGVDLRTLTGPGGIFDVWICLIQIFLTFIISFIMSWCSTICWIHHCRTAGRSARSGPGSAPAIKSASVHAFMIHMYFSASEPMPTGWLDSKIQKNQSILSGPFGTDYQHIVGHISSWNHVCCFKVCLQICHQRRWWSPTTGVTGQASWLAPHRSNFPTEHQPQSSDAATERATPWKLE